MGLPRLRSAARHDGGGGMSRERLPNRRACETLSFRCNGLNYVASIGRFADGRIADVFISNGKAGSHSDAAARDSSITFSIACQYGADPAVIRRALCRDARGVASSPLGVVLDLLQNKNENGFDFGNETTE